MLALSTHFKREAFMKNVYFVKPGCSSAHPHYLSSLGLSAFYLVLCNKINFRVRLSPTKISGENWGSQTTREMGGCFPSLQTVSLLFWLLR